MRGTISGNVTARFITFLIIVFGVAVSAAAGGALPCNLQLGSIPRTADGGGWSLAVPLGAPASACRLETTSPALQVVTAPAGDEAWLVFRPVADGPVSGLLEIRSGQGGPPHRTAVAGEVVDWRPGAPPALLVVSARGDAAERRFLRFEGLPQPTGCVMDRTLARLGSATAGGWIPLDIEPAAGIAESGGRLTLGTAGLSVPVQYSVVETITVLARSALPQGWRYARLHPFDETLAEGRLRGRAAVIGRRDGGASLRVYELRYDARQGRRVLRRRFASELPDYGGTGEVAVRSLLVHDGQAEPGARGRRLLTLGDETAALWHPLEGRMGVRSTPGLRATGAVAASRRHRNALFVLRREAGGGATWLRRWTVAADGGRGTLRGRRAEFPLEQRLGLRGLRAFAMTARRDFADWPGKSATERLLLLAARDGGAKAPSPVALYTLILDPDDPARILSARRSFSTRLRWAAGDPPPYLAYARGRLIGGEGYPARLETGIPDLTPGRYIDITGLGGRFAGSPFVDGVRHSIRAGAYGFETPKFLGLENAENSATVRRYRYVGETIELRAEGVIAEEQGVALRRSRRLRHAWLVTAEPGGGPEARYSLRLLTNGVAPGTNLPPRADAGADLRSAVPLVELRVDAVDPDGDPLEIRWSSPGVEFSDPRAAVTSARFPEGETQVRVAVREAEGTYEAVDLVRVRYVSPSAAGHPPGLRTRITGLHPNPANPRLQVAFTLDRSGPARVTVHDLSGRLVRVLVDEVRGAGAWDVTWNGDDAAGRPVASGVYLVQLSAAGGADARRGAIVR